MITHGEHKCELIGQRIRNARESINMSMKELAMLVHISRGTLCHIELEGCASLCTLIDICHVLGISLDSVVEGVSACSSKRGVISTGDYENDAVVLQIIKELSTCDLKFNKKILSIVQTLKG